MKDMVPKGTGNSRFLRSNIPEDITHEELVALLRAGTFPVDFAGLNFEGIATQGSAYNKANVLPDSVCNLLGIPTSAEPKDAFLAIFASGWKEYERITTSKKWTVPFGVNRIGVFLLSGGASGGTSNISQPSSSYRTSSVNGGQSGWGLSIVLDVTPGQSFDVVIGSGGVSSNGISAPGGDTKFGSHVALCGGKENHGGYGVQDCTSLYWYALSRFSGKTLLSPYGGVSGCIGNGNYSDTDYYVFWLSLAAPNEKNIFDPSMKLFSLGGGASAYWGSSSPTPELVKIAPADLGEMGKGGELKIVKSGTSGTSYYGEDATGYGNGGGAIINQEGKGDFFGGKGSQGIVIIYV